MRLNLDDPNRLLTDKEELKLTVATVHAETKTGEVYEIKSKTAISSEGTLEPRPEPEEEEDC